MKKFRWNKVFVLLFLPSSFFLDEASRERMIINVTRNPKHLVFETPERP